MNQVMNFDIRIALKLTYEHLEVKKKFPGATPPGPPRGGEGRGRERGGGGQWEGWVKGLGREGIRWEKGKG